MNRNLEKPNNRKIQTDEHRQQKKSKYTAVLGDSLLRGIRRDKISRSTKRRVSIGCFPGATIEDMKYYIKPTYQENLIILFYILTRIIVSQIL